MSRVRSPLLTQSTTNTERGGANEAPPPQSITEIAGELLKLAGEGDAGSFALSDRLSEEVLRLEIVKLALAIAGGGPHKIARGIELAVLIRKRGLGWLADEVERRAEGVG